MAARDQESGASDLDTFEPYPAFHEDELQAKHSGRHVFNFRQVSKRKRKARSSIFRNEENDIVGEAFSEPLQPRNILAAVMDVSDDDISPESQLELSPSIESATAVDLVPVPSMFAYATELMSNNAVTFLDRNCTMFALPDFDRVVKKLHEAKYVLVTREARENIWLFNCSCPESSRRTNYLQSLSSTITEAALIAADAVYAKCMHVTTIEMLMEGFDRENNIHPLAAYLDSRIHDHSYQVENSYLLPLNGKDFTLFVRGSQQHGVVGLQGAQMTCFTCYHHVDTCEHVMRVTAAEENLEEEMPDFLVDFVAERNYRNSLLSSAASMRKEWKLTSASKITIPFCLTLLQKQVFLILEEVLQRMQLCDTGFVLLTPATAVDQHPSCPKCSSFCTEQYKEVVCFLKKRTFQCKVSYYTCTDENCDGKVEFDGTELTLLNMGSFVISYEVLRDFMFHFLKGRCTLFTYYSVWQEIMFDAGVVDFKRLLSYHHWRFAWYSFLDLLAINYDEGFCCPMCGNDGNLDIVICDATSLSFRQELCTSLKSNLGKHSTRTRQVGSRHRDRVYISEKRVRQMLDQVGRDVSKVTDATMTSLHLELQRCAPALDSFLIWCDSFYGTDDPFPIPISRLFTALGKASPVCALLPQLDSLEEFYRKLIGNEPLKECPEYMLLLQQTSPLLFDVLSAVEGDKLPDALSALILDLLEKAKTPFSRSGPRPDAEQLNEQPSRVNDLEYFPCLPIVRSRGDYCLDNTTPYDNICTKRSTRHPSLLPGIFLVHCKHGITYGFSVMLCNESPNIPFTVFRMRFSQAPGLIVYDNACNLHSYCLNRDPAFFKNSQFLVDRLHWRDHTGCSEAYNLSSYPQWDSLNSQAAEQANSCLTSIKGSLSYMNEKNFINHCKFFIWYRNSLRRQKLTQVE